MSKKGILLVDDEPQALKYFSKALGDQFPVLAAGSAREALALLETNRDAIGVIVTDQRMPEASGIELLKIVRDRFPHTVRVLTTAYTEMDLLVEAINTGAVYSFVSKPWEVSELAKTLSGAMSQHESQLHEAALLDQTIEDLREKLLEDRAYDVGLVAAKIGHYVHNALCPLTILIDLLLDQRQDPAKYSVEFLQSVRAHVFEVARTLKDLEKVSVPAAPEEYESLNLETIFAKALRETESIRHQKHLRIESEPMSALPPIRAVPSQIEKLFRFMIAEEAVSLPQGSLVRLRSAPQMADGEVLGVNLTFEDEVPVAPQMDPGNLLHPFNLRGPNPREFGIFLLSCYFIARHHGGSLNASVRPDRSGIAFSFFLPSDPEEALRADSSAFRSRLFSSRRDP